MSDTLVDTSVWVSFLRGIPAAKKALDLLLVDDRVAIAGPIFAEILSGARSRPEFDRLRALLDSLPWLSLPGQAWERTADVRFSLARLGHQAAFADVLIALSAFHSGHRLLTRDQDFSTIRTVLPFDLELLP